MDEFIQRVLLDETTILSRLDSLAGQITRDYRGKDLMVVAILNGSIIFSADLLRRIPLPLQIDGWRVSSYAGTESTGQITFGQTAVADLRGRHLLILDDILDTGLTLSAVRDHLQNTSGALSIKTCVLLRKQVKRIHEIEADYVGFDIPNEFVIGYGLDYNEKYRNLPYVGILTPEAIAAG
jgi:hypoxanthine phosphoribosyltransferase